MEEDSKAYEELYLAWQAANKRADNSRRELNETIERNGALREERDDARRWAAAWKESAKANHDAYQDGFLTKKRTRQAILEFIQERNEALALVGALREAVRVVLDYKAGHREFNFSHLTLAEQGQLHYDCWISTVKPRLDAALALTPPAALEELKVQLQESSPLAAQIFAYREVLMFYGTGGNHSELVPSDGGQRARAALLRDAPTALAELEARVKGEERRLVVETINARYEAADD